MSAELGDFGGTFARTVTAGGGAGLGLEATEELSQPTAASANAAAKNSFALLLMINPLDVWPWGIGPFGILRSESDI